MISFFTIPREFNDKYNDIQSAAIKSWLLVDDKVEVWLVGNDRGVGKACSVLGSRVHHIPSVNRSPWRTPLIDDAFRKAIALAKFDIMCYVNTDIVFVGGLRRTVENVDTMFALAPEWVITGRRLDITPKYRDAFLGGRSAGKIPGELHCGHGEDYFIFRKGVYDYIPPFAVGRSAWDNWLLLDAQLRGINTVEATRTIHAIHLGKTKLHHTITDEYRYNQNLWRENRGRDRGGWVNSAEWATGEENGRFVMIRREKA